MVLSHMSIIEQVFLIGQELVTDYDMGIFSPEVSAHLSLENGVCELICRSSLEYGAGM